MARDRSEDAGETVLRALGMGLITPPTAPLLYFGALIGKARPRLWGYQPP